MCLAIPGEILEIRSNDELLGRKGLVRFGDVTREVCLAYVPEAGVGDYVIVHVGFAISILQKDEAERTLAYWRQIEAEERGDASFSA